MTDDPIKSPLWPADNPAATSHIALLQGIISRLADNSASCKTWCLTLVAAVLSVAGSARAPAVVHAVVVPIVVFCFLDIMYLATEKAYRGVYKTVVDDIRNSRYTIAKVFAAGAQWRGDDVLSALRSWSVFPYYALILAYIAAEYFGWVNVFAAVPPAGH